MMGKGIIPDNLRHTHLEMRGDEGKAWLDRLPDLLAACVEEWSLDLKPPFESLSFNYAAPVDLPDGSPAVLKVCFPDKEFFNEVGALHFYNGQGVNRLLAVDLGRGAMLLERILPGVPLSTVQDDEEAARIAAGVMRQLWKTIPDEHSFPLFSTWVAGMAQRAPQRISGSAFPSRWIDYVLGLYADLVVDPANFVLLHGDLHQGNILTANRTPWLAIDPKGMAGEPVCEIGPLLLNALPDDASLTERRRIIDCWVAVLAEELNFDIPKLRAWAVVRSVLAAFWSLEDQGYGWEWAINCAEALISS